VVAVRENPAAAILLELAGEGEDPLAAAGKPLPEGARADSAPEPMVVNQLPAARVRASLRGRDGPLRAEFWWIALDGRVYRITGMSDAQAFAGLSPQFSASAESFHRLGASERSAIREDRLRSERARAGETLASVLARAGSRWKPGEAAVANALPLDGALAAGQLVKITRPEPYPQ
jgi:predicted Zn-dependent protease